MLNVMLFKMRAERTSCARHITLDWIELFADIFNSGLNVETACHRNEASGTGISHTTVFFRTTTITTRSANVFSLWYNFSFFSVAFRIIIKVYYA